NIPAMCDLAASEVGRQGGWPKPTRAGRDLDLQKILETTDYFDLIFLAPAIRVPTNIAIGLMDRACPPFGVFAFANQVQGPVEIQSYPLLGHDWTPLQKQR